MNISYSKLIISVITDFRVIGTIVVMLIVVEFAKYITSYKKKTPKPKTKKTKAPAPVAAPAAEAEAAAEGGGDAAGTEE